MIISNVATLVTVGLLLGGSAGIAVYAVPHMLPPGGPVSGREEAYLFEGAYTFAPSIVTDAEGRIRGPAPPGAPAAVQQMLPRGGAEPSIGVTSDGRLFVVVADDVFRSSDQGRTWEPVRSFVTDNYPTTVDRYSTRDPVLWVDAATDRIFVLHVTPDAGTIPYFSTGIWCADLQWSDDGGDTWQTTPARDTSCDTPFFFDHPKLVSAAHGPKAVLPLGAVQPYPNVVYLCNNKIVMGTWCAVSYDGGLTWAHSTPPRLPVSTGGTPAACPGTNGRPAAYPDGTVAVPLCGRGPRGPVVAVTENDGLSWSVHEFPGDVGQVEIDPSITVTPDGIAYVAFRGADQALYLVRSPDKFQSWDGPFRVSPTTHVMNVFAAVTSGDDGRIAVAYFGTETNQSDPKDELLPPEQRPKPQPLTARPGTHWHLFVSTSFDAAEGPPTFVTQQVTPVEDPVQVGCISPSPTLPQCRNHRDSIDLVRDSEGRFFVAHTDGCTPRTGCTGDTDLAMRQSADMEVSVSVQDRGLSLFVAKGELPSLGLEPPARYPK